MNTNIRLLEEQHTYLTRCLGLTPIETYDYETKSTCICYINIKHVALPGVYRRLTSHTIAISDYVLDLTHYSWLKIRIPIKPLSDVEKLLYGKT